MRRQLAAQLGDKDVAIRFNSIDRIPSSEINCLHKDLSEHVDLRLFFTGEFLVRPTEGHGKTLEVRENLSGH